jgi:ABC-2 type transport system ATP-binding protein
MIGFERVCYGYPEGRHLALQNVSFSLPQGAVMALLGPNGAGKTTLLRILCGRIPGYSGGMRIPRDWSLSDGRLDPAKVGVLIENPGIYARLTVQEYLEFFGSFYVINDLKSRIKRLAEQLHFKDLHHRMATLSLGTRQKVQIIRCLLHNPALVLLDEPSSNLDPAARDVLWDVILESSHQLGTTVIVCSHQLSEMEEHCSHMGFLRSGQLLASGPLADLRKAHLIQSQVTLRLGSALEAQAMVKGIPLLESGTVEGDRIVFLSDNPDGSNPSLVSEIVGRGGHVVEIVVERPRLAELYRKLVHD